MNSALPVLKQKVCQTRGGRISGRIGISGWDAELFLGRNDAGVIGMNHGKRLKTKWKSLMGEMPGRCGKMSQTRWRAAPGPDLCYHR